MSNRKTIKTTGLQDELELYIIVDVGSGKQYDPRAWPSSGPTRNTLNHAFRRRRRVRSSVPSAGDEQYTYTLKDIEWDERTRLSSYAVRR